MPTKQYRELNIDKPESQQEKILLSSLFHKRLSEKQKRIISNIIDISTQGRQKEPRIKLCKLLCKL